MHRVLAVALSLALISSGVPLVAAGAGAPRAAQSSSQTGTLTGNAANPQGQPLASYTVRLRNLTSGSLVGTTTSDSAGAFAFAGLNPGNYMVEVVNASGEIVATSAAIGVAAGGTVSVTVTASAAAALASAAAGGSFFGSTAGVLTIAALGAGVTGVVVGTRGNGNASPSR